MSTEREQVLNEFVERSRDLLLLYQRVVGTSNVFDGMSVLTAALATARREEREACAKVCQARAELYTKQSDTLDTRLIQQQEAEGCMQAIRQREG